MKVLKQIPANNNRKGHNHGCDVALNKQQHHGVMQGCKLTASSSSSPTPENPRAHGANDRLSCANRTELGKPPRSRGKPLRGLVVLDVYGKTPALTGQTLTTR